MRAESLTYPQFQSSRHADINKVVDILISSFLIESLYTSRSIWHEANFFVWHIFQCVLYELKFTDCHDVFPLAAFSKILGTNVRPKNGRNLQSVPGKTLTFPLFMTFDPSCAL